MNINDIVQGRHGDCFILASIISILHTLGEKIIRKIITDEVQPFYYFSFWKNNKKYSIKLNETNIKTISPKCDKWVKKIEYSYIYVFYSNNMNKIINDGGLSQKVIADLIGIKPKLYINRLFDNNEFEYDSIFSNIISKKNRKYIEWNNNFITKKIEKWLNMIWFSLISITDFEECQKNNIFNLKYPCVLGIYCKKHILGIVNEHAYSILGIMIDNFDNKYIQVFNPQRNVECRKTSYSSEKKKYISEIENGRYGIWSLDECSLFVSDFTISFH